MIAASLPADGPLGITKEGVLFLGNSGSLGGQDIFLAEIDPGSGEITAQPTKLVRRFEGINDWPNFSRDGRFLAYVSARGTRATIRNRRNTLCILELGTGKTKEFPTEFDQLFGPKWGPDNNAVILVAAYVTAVKLEG